MNLQIKSDNNRTDEHRLIFCQSLFNEKSSTEEMLLKVKAFVSAAIDGLASLHSVDASVDNMKVNEIAILDLSFDTVETINEYITNEEQLIESPYTYMVRWYEHVLKESCINEAELLDLAEKSRMTFSIEEIDDKYVLMITLGDRSFFIRELSSINENEMEVEALKMISFCIVLFDKADRFYMNDIGQLCGFKPFYYIQYREKS